MGSQGKTDLGRHGRPTPLPSRIFSIAKHLFPMLPDWAGGWRKKVKVPERQSRRVRRQEGVRRVSSLWNFAVAALSCGRLSKLAIPFGMRKGFLGTSPPAFGTTRACALLPLSYGERGELPEFQALPKPGGEAETTPKNRI